MWTANVGKKKKFNVAYEESKRKEDSKFSDFFNMFFGEVETEKKIEKKSRKVAIKGENVETEINISLYDAFFGKEKKIALRTVEGDMKAFSVKVPAGIRNDEKIRLSGLGKLGSNGAPNGDMFIKIKIENDKKYRLEGSDLVTDLYLTPWEAALGAKAEVPCIDGQTALVVPPGIGSNDKIRIPNKGYKDGTGGRGDLVAEVKIMVPKEVSTEEKELFEKMSQISNFSPRQNFHEAI